MYNLSIIGFETGGDPSIPNEIVKRLLIESFGEEALQTAKVESIRKIPLILIFVSMLLEKETRANMHSFLFCSPLRIYHRPNQVDLYFADDLEDYLGLAMHLEKVDDPKKLKHLFKVRAFAGNPYTNSQIEIGRFVTEKPTNYDYLNDCGLKDTNDLMRAYILGTVCHEIAHRLQKTLPKGWDDIYRIIVTEEVNSDLRKKFVSDYVILHEEIYNADQKTIENEDLVEAIRILMTNPKYLEDYYPRRYEFLRRTLPYIKPGSVIQAIKSI